MSERDWMDLNDPWDRLAWARQRVYDSAAAAARALNMNDSTYRAYERSPDSSKATKLDLDLAQKFGRRFGVNWLWILAGVGKPFDPEKFGDEAGSRLGSLLLRMTEQQKKALLTIAEGLVGTSQQAIDPATGLAEDPADFDHKPRRATKRGR